jgi:hypothetical protein
MLIGQIEEIRALKKRYKWAKDNRDSYRRPEWEDLSKFISPAHGRFLDTRDTIPARGEVDRSAIINSTATRAKAIAVSGIKGGLVPHSLEWFKLGLQDEEMQEYEPVKEWLHAAERTMYGVFNRSNFYEAIYSPFEEQITFGTGPFQINEHPTHVIHCDPWTVGEYTLISGPYKTVDTGFRRYWLTARVIAERWGVCNMSAHARGLLENNPDSFIEVVHCIMPRKDIDTNKMDCFNMPWASIWFEAKGAGELILGESGYCSQPVMFPRWVVVGEDPYGPDCPAMEVLGDVKMLQRMERDKLRALALIIDPPMNVPSSMYGRLKTAPRSQNIVSGTENDAIRETLAGVNFDIERIDRAIQTVERRISEGFFNDLFLMMLGQERSGTTAFEIAKKHEEKLTLLGPVIERQNSELLTPVIERVFDICYRRGLIPPPPEEISQAEMRVEYISLLAQAQKAVGVNAIERGVGFITNLSEAYPEARYKIDALRVANEYAAMQGMSPRLLRSDDEAQAMYDQTMQAQQAAVQQEQQMAAAVNESEVAKNMAEVAQMQPAITQSFPAI